MLCPRTSAWVESLEKNWSSQAYILDSFFLPGSLSLPTASPHPLPPFPCFSSPLFSSLPLPLSPSFFSLFFLLFPPFPSLYPLLLSLFLKVLSNRAFYFLDSPSNARWAEQLFLVLQMRNLRVVKRLADFSWLVNGGASTSLSSH